MKISKTFSIALLMFFLVSCGPAKIVANSTPTFVPLPIAIPLASISPMTPTAVTNSTTYNVYCSKSPSNCVNSLAVDQKGFLWAATSNGIYRWDISKSEYTHFDLPSYVNQIALTKDGDIWVEAHDNDLILNNGGIYKYEDNKWILQTDLDNPLGEMIPQADGSLWIGGGFGGAYYYQNNTWINLKKFPVFASYVVSITKGYDNKLWAVITGEKQPVYVVHQINGDWETIKEFEGDAGIENGSLWLWDHSLGLNLICQMDLDVKRNENCFSSPDSEMYFVPFASPKEIWLFPLYYYDAPKGSIWRHIDGRWQKFIYQGSENDRPSSLTIAPDGAIFIGLYGGGIVRYDGHSVVRYIVNN